ncbi:phosphoglucosamine mutase [Aquimarina sp. MMG015]|uniref:phosphoglucosamine mutase n=1 Tax=unclassified Aquimarina TaxID=2627091 RepID=UPI000E531F8C|nr:MULTISPECIES: phosphoglucosamine mutase [unclassified Aquimarina]AXT55753.1 phosphoglucosamine mutase [Aquimarina sp. AD1]MBQ4805434.1 phosphoglucosamine mutase [Aquimarina sp. MMG015]RKN15616.1 phosphoglucosamine mutase [Aquimarina sp. AD1]
MTLIKSISGIRGTIGGKVGDNLTPIDAVKFASAYGSWLKAETNKEHPIVVVGRDARISGSMIQQLVMNGLIGLGIHVVDLGLSTTPTVEVAVPLEKADGGIILTASHNPKQWNALKLLDGKGEFLNAENGKKILDIAENDDYQFAEVDDLGSITTNDTYIDKHIEEVLNLSLVNSEIVKEAGFKVVVDAVNSTGGIAIPKLLKKMGVEVVELYCEPNGHFPHNPEPLKEHLTDLSELVVKEKADFGLTVDPDVDRLAFMSEDGEMFGEEYTLVACADFVLGKTPGNTVSNLSSSRALRDVTEKHNGTYEASAVGEVNVVSKMKANNAIIGGEGNGGIIYPELHYGRDSLVGVALFLTHLAEKKCSVSALRNSYPSYFMSKNKVQLTPELNVDEILKGFHNKHVAEEVSTVDGVKVDFSDSWVHLRKSNTEPIIRIYTEALSQKKADQLANDTIATLKEIAGI